MTITSDQASGKVSDRVSDKPSDQTSDKVSDAASDQASMPGSGEPSDGWETVCPLDRLPLERGVAALVGGQAVALFRLRSGELYAIDHNEPFTGMPVMARGLVGSVGETPTVASPLHKQRFDLRTGTCLDDPDHPITAWSVRLIGDNVQISMTPVETG